MIAVTAVLAIAGGTTAAMADTTAGTGVGYVAGGVNVAVRGTNTVTASGTYQDVGTQPGEISLLVECTATGVGTPVPVATGISQCYLLGTGPEGGTYYVPSNALPGAADVTASAVLTVPLQNYQICYQGEALLQNGAYLQTSEQCYG